MASNVGLDRHVQLVVTALLWVVAKAMSTMRSIPDWAMTYTADASGNPPHNSIRTSQVRSSSIDRALTHPAGPTIIGQAQFYGGLAGL
ncbi:MAG: hypothetical protein R3242_08890 [Akkermansiaceae bacterium]|nr:hypothetical protein [Akkermansiaceae bacterium]